MNSQVRRTIFSVALLSVFWLTEAVPLAAQVESARVRIDLVPGTWHLRPKICTRCDSGHPVLFRCLTGLFNQATVAPVWIAPFSSRRGAEESSRISCDLLDTRTARLQSWALDPRPSD